MLRQEVQTHQGKANLCSMSSSCSSVAPDLHNLIDCDVGRGIAKDAAWEPPTLSTSVARNVFQVGIG